MFSKIFLKHASDHQKHDFSPRVIAHYGIPSSASYLACDPIQQLLAVGTLDGRIKVIGSDTTEGLLSSPKEIPFKNLEFLQNHGFLISISGENDVQVWDLKQRCVASTLQWKSNITAFAVVQETTFMYIGDECGLVSVLKYDIGERKLSQQPYSITVQSVSEAAGITLLNHQSVVGILPQPCSSGNRVLFAYKNGVIVLWDISKDKLLLTRGYNSSANTGTNGQKDQSQTSDNKEENKQILSLCWASLDGSLLATGYTDGDIMLWNLSDDTMNTDEKTGKLADNVVKIQVPSLNKGFLSFFQGTSSKRSPIICLRWCASKSNTSHGGHLFVYGGNEIESAEVLTILSLEWSPQKDTLQHVVRVNINLQGSLLDMILLDSSSVPEDAEVAPLFILSNPGQLQFYDSSCLSALVSQKDKSVTVPIHYRSAVPTTEPHLTVGRLISVHANTKCLVALSEKATTAGHQEGHQSGDKIPKWPLNGGVPCHLTSPGDRDIERLYIAGYQDGSVRIWDATYPLLSKLLCLNPEVRSVTVDGVTAPVSALDFSSETLFVSVGKDSGLVCLYNLSGNRDETGLHVVTDAKDEVFNQDQDQGQGSLLSAVFKLNGSPVCTLRYMNLGARLAVGYENGQVAMLNIKPSSVLFLIDTFPNLSSPVTSFASAILPDAGDPKTTSEKSESHGNNEPGKELTLALRRDSRVAVLDSSNGNVITSFPQNHDKELTAISLYVLDGAKYVIDVSDAKYMHLLSEKKKKDNKKHKKDKEKSEAAQITDNYERKWDGIDRSAHVVQSAVDLQILLCCKDTIKLCSLKSVIQGKAACTKEVNLLKAGCWTAIFKRDKKTCALIVVHQSGTSEIRSLPNLELVEEPSLMSILRWSFMTNMERLMSSTENGQITLVNDCEFAVVSLLAHGNDFRIPQYLPCLHDKTMAAALDMNSSSTQKKNKLWDGLVSGFKPIKGTKEPPETMEPETDQKSIQSSLDKNFSRSTGTQDGGDVVELNIDNIKLAGPSHASTTTDKNETKKKEKKSDIRKLFGGATSKPEPVKPPRQRTVGEIKAQYRKEDPEVSSAFAAASEARDKLIERQEKLDRITQNSEELNNEAQDFAAAAKLLAKKMEKRKWWQL